MSLQTDGATQAQRKRGVRLTIAIILAFITLVMLGFLNKITTPRVLNEYELRANGAFVFDKPRIFADFALTDHRDATFTPERFKGKWSLVFFGFTHCPDICPTTLATLNAMINNLDDDIRANTQVVLVTVDPARDTVAKLSEYIPYFNQDFVGVTGEFIDIKRFANQLNVAFAKVVEHDVNGEVQYSVDHSGNIALINPYGHYHGFLKPPLDVARMKLTYLSIRGGFRG